MDAKKKHLKALRRERKLKKRFSQEPDVPIRLVLKPFEFGTRLKNFEETALEKISMNRLTRQLKEYPQFRNLCKDLLSGENDKSFNALMRVLPAIMICICFQGGAVPPYFVPIPSNLYAHNGKIVIEFSIFRPQKIIDKLGNLYHYFFHVDLGDRGSKEVWFTGHALDRIKERLSLETIDVSTWMYILSPRFSGSWKVIRNERGSYLCCDLDGCQDNIGVSIPLFFPYEERDDKVICMTYLTPEMNTPEVIGREGRTVVKPEDFSRTIAETRIKYRGIPIPFHNSPQGVDVVAPIKTIRY